MCFTKMLSTFSLISLGALAQASQIPDVKYPAAIVLEGGEGNPFDATNGKKPAPKWRLYLCLQKTDQPITDQFVIDLSRLGGVYEQSWKNFTADQLVFTERLNQVTLNYTYQTEIHRNAKAVHPYAFGKADIVLTSQQEWQTIYQAPGANGDESELLEDWNIFDAKVNKTSLGHFNVYAYNVNGKPYYVSNRYERFRYSEPTDGLKTIKTCENADQAQILQIGDDIDSTEE